MENFPIIILFQCKKYFKVFIRKTNANSCMHKIKLNLMQQTYKMQEKTLLKIALIASLAGLLILYLISSNIEIKESNIEKITIENKDEFVKLSGIVSNLVNSEKVMILEITQPQEITVVLFKNKNNTFNINKGNEVEIFGKVDEYNGKMEIIAERVRVIS